MILYCARDVTIVRRGALRRYIDTEATTYIPDKRLYVGIPQVWARCVDMPRSSARARSCHADAAHVLVTQCTFYESVVVPW